MTDITHEIQIPLSKKKIVFLLIGALVFVVFGILFVNNPDRYVSPVVKNRSLVFIVGLLAIIFFGIGCVVLVKKFMDKTPGLILSDEGIFDNSGGVSAGNIHWADIENITVLEISRQKLIMIHVKNPEMYIDRQTSFFKRKLMSLNYKMYGTPISITSNALDISFDKLLAILTKKLAASRK